MVMFLCAVAHPCYNTATISWWDGGKQLNGNNLIMNVHSCLEKQKQNTRCLQKSNENKTNPLYYSKVASR